MITFTRQALQIEAKRDYFLKYYLEKGYVSLIVCTFFLRPTGTEDFPTAPELRVQMLLLDSPPSLQSVKDALVEAYRLEIEGGQCVPYIDRFNVDSYKKGEGPYYIPFSWTLGPWVMAQEIRRDAYIKWAQIRGKHGIDPASVGISLP